MTEDILSTVCEPVREMFCATTCLRVTSCLCSNFKLENWANGHSVSSGVRILRTLLLNVSKNGSNSGPACLVMPVFSNLISLLDKTVDSTGTWVQIGPDLPVILL